MENVHTAKLIKKIHSLLPHCRYQGSVIQKMALRQVGKMEVGDMTVGQMKVGDMTGRQNGSRRYDSRQNGSRRYDRSAKWKSAI
jgi:hypothetical protein